MINASIDLIGKKAIVGGGVGDLGTAMVLALYNAGVEVVVLARLETLDQWVKEHSQPDKPPIIGIRTDLTDREQLKANFSIAVEILGGLDILLNCQGVQRRYPAEEFPVEVWDEVIDVNLTSVFMMCQLAARVMMEQKSGKIINIASMQSFTGGTNIPAYAASKGGLAILTKSFANAWAKYNISVNAIAPGYFDTKMTAGVKNDPARYDQILSRIPAGYWGDPRDICGPLLFLASSWSDYVNGVILPVDGGLLGNL